ncbi:MAG: hypothetical protein Q7S22_00175 [Candidatus Micrarchaeota archaeon]|nr:hypothetical protein [Candidatus Micrarchaeota archaeon]
MNRLLRALHPSSLHRGNQHLSFSPDRRFSHDHSIRRDAEDIFGTHNLTCVSGRKLGLAKGITYVVAANGRKLEHPVPLDFARMPLL